MTGEWLLPSVVDPNSGVVAGLYLLTACGGHLLARCVLESCPRVRRGLERLLVGRR